MRTRVRRRRSILVFGLGYLTEDRRSRRRRLDDEAVSAGIAFLDPPPEDVGDALRRYALILDQYSEAEARVRFLLPESLHRELSEELRFACLDR
jgi:hypothetical protein